MSTALLSGCNAQEKDRQAIAQVIESRSRALNSRDVPLYLSSVSPDYSDKGKDFPRLKESITSNFNNIEKLSYQPLEHEISISGNRAEASGTYRMKIITRGKELVLDGAEHLKFARGAEGWKIVAGL
ncbi:MAG: nuclear transport factor 2 family protein [Geobacteraceae bacterium]|nr:nuclear transport factor 2 family protein [Geobacteraceae bacterium]